MSDSPLVLCLTNTVAANFTANCLLAVGAKPAMVEEPSEAAELAAVADAVLVNVGTVHERQAEAMRRAVRAANERGTPWVLDPVGVQFLSYRQGIVRELLALGPTLIRGNRDEISFLQSHLHELSGEGRASSRPNLSNFTSPFVTLATGEVDTITPDLTVSGGVPLLRTVTATGCAQGGVCAACLGRGLSPTEAALAASRLMKRAGELAWEKSHEPGSFKVALVDALWRLSHD